MRAAKPRLQLVEVDYVKLHLPERPLHDGKPVDLARARWALVGWVLLGLALLAVGVYFAWQAFTMPLHASVAP